MDMYMDVVVFSRSEDHGYDMLQARKLVESEEIDLDMEDFDYEAALKRTRKAPELKPYPEEWLKSFPVRYNPQYLLKRGVPKETCAKFDIRWDPIRNRVCFPFRTFDGTLAGMQGRDVTGHSKIRYLTYTYKKQKNGHVWLNEQNVEKTKAIVLVEGPVDAMKVASIYPNVLAAMTSQITEPKFDRVKDAPALITFFDEGDAGEKARQRVKWLAKDTSVMHVTPPPGREDPGEMTIEEIATALEFIT
jgi:DNA primase